MLFFENICEQQSRRAIFVNYVVDINFSLSFSTLIKKKHHSVTPTFAKGQISLFIAIQFVYVCVCVSVCSVFAGVVFFQFCLGFFGQNMVGIE